MDIFKAIKKVLGEKDFIAEDLGYMTDSVRQLVKESGFPGMKVLEFAFDSRDTGCRNDYLPHNYSENCIAYTGTHDNETLKGWVSSQSSDTLKYCMAYLGVKKKKDIPKNIIKQTWASVAQTAIAQMQDFLNSDASARMNTPSTLGNNWQFRTSEDDFTDKLAKRILKLNKMYNR